MDDEYIPYKCMFNRTLKALSEKEASVARVHTMDPFAGTVNINPAKRFGKTRWRDETAEAQEYTLLRHLQQAMAWCKIPSESLEYYFETCPHLNQRHIHFLYYSNLELTSNLIRELEKRVGMPPKHKYTTTVLKECTDVAGWKQYMKKDINLFI